MTLNDFENNKITNIEKRFLINLKQIYNMPLSDFHVDKNDELASAWDILTIKQCKKQFSELIKELDDSLYDIELFAPRYSYVIEELLFILSLLARNYKTNNNKVVKEFFSISYSRYRQFVNKNICAIVYSLNKR